MGLSKFLDLDNPVSDHPDNAGLLLRLYGGPQIPGVGGASLRWPDMANRAGLVGPRYTTGPALVNSPAWVSTGLGSFGLSFSGTSYAVVTLSLTLADATLAAWVYPRTVVNYGRAIDADYVNGCWLGRNATNSELGGMFASTNQSPFGAFAPCVENAWNRVVVSRVGPTTTAYVNKAAGTPFTPTVNQSASITTFAVGQNRTTNPGQDQWDGVIAGVLLMSRGVDQGWVNRDYAWTQSPQSDPRLRWLTPKSWYFMPTGGGTVTGTGSSAGTSTALAVGHAYGRGAGSAAGTATASGVGDSTARSAGSTAGTATATAAGASTATGVGSAAGTSTAAGFSQGTQDGTGTASGTSTAAATGRSTARTAGTASGTCTAAAAGVGYGRGVGNSDGSCTVSGVGRSKSSAAGSASGTSVAHGFIRNASGGGGTGGSKILLGAGW